MLPEPGEPGAEPANEEEMVCRPLCVHPHNAASFPLPL